MKLSGLRVTSKVATEWKYPLVEPRRTGHQVVDREAGHQLYWEEYGAPDGEPVMFLHGGPGGACTPTMARFFDPARYRVILFDQRGCGKSIPTVASAGATVALKNNDTDHLVADINTLRSALGIDRKMHLFGGSWGSTLALTYAIRHPENVSTMILRGIFLGTEEDLHYMYQGNAATYASAPFGLTAPGSYVAYPDEWSAFVEPIPVSERSDLMAAYKAIFNATPSDTAERERQLAAARSWSMWEGAISNMIPESADPGKFSDAEFALCFAQIESHFFANRLFLEPDYILRNVQAIASIPIHIVHGRFDQVCPLTQASRLVAALKATHARLETYVRTDAGHSAMEGQNVIALTEIMDGLPKPVA